MKAVIFNGNMLTLSSISSSNLNATNYNFGIQFKTKERIFANQNVEITYLKKETDIAIDSINSDSNLTVGAITRHYLEFPNVFKITTTFTEGGFDVCKTAELSLARITTKYDSAQNAYGLWQGDSVSNFLDDVISVECINRGLLAFDGDLPDTNVVGNNTTRISVLVEETGDKLCTVVVHYIVRDDSAPEVEFIGGQSIYFAVGDTFVEYRGKQDFNAKKELPNGTKVPYVYDYAYTNSSQNPYASSGISDNYALVSLLSKKGANRHMTDYSKLLDSNDLFLAGDAFGLDSQIDGFYKDFKFHNNEALGITFTVDAIEENVATITLRRAR